MRKGIFLLAIIAGVICLTACTKSVPDYEIIQNKEDRGKEEMSFLSEQSEQKVLWSGCETVAWYPYEESDLIYNHDFIKSRDGQGYHWWIYWEIFNIMCDYGGRVEYDFTMGQWTAERIYPTGGGYYNAVVSQDDREVSIDLLFHPDEKKYVILYAEYEDGDRTAGVNQIPYASQLEWQDFDFYEDYEICSIENPFKDICETSVSSVLYIALYHYEQETAYTGEWKVRELFGRSPFFDYFIESEQGFLWFCIDIGQHSYTYVSF